MDNNNTTIENDKEKMVTDLLEKNPEVNLAKKIMDQARKTKLSAVVIDQSNYYRLPSAS